jgi:hypothetical protein
MEHPFFFLQIDIIYESPILSKQYHDKGAEMPGIECFYMWVKTLKAYFFMTIS